MSSTGNNVFGQVWKLVLTIVNAPFQLSSQLFK